MTVLYLLVLSIGVVLAVVGLVFFNKRPRRGTVTLAATETSKEPLNVLAVKAPDDFLPEVMAPLPHAIVLGGVDMQPGVRIAPLSDEEKYRRAKALPEDSMLAAKLSACLQAVPSLFVTEGHRGKHLMEVVINGGLVRAKDCDALRAWAVDSNNRITEHAKLFAPEKLQAMVNVAAVWQVASVVVAQQHLAEISAKLDDIRKGVQDISDFLKGERRAKVTAIYEYLELAASSISSGELPPAIRTELETCERELLQVQEHLMQELVRGCSQKVEHKEMFGTADLHKDTVAKYERLKDLAKDLRLTLKTRALAWHVLSLYPGEPALKRARMDRLLRSADEVAVHLRAIDSDVERDCQELASMWNKDITLEIRKTNVREAAQALSSDLLAGAHETRTDVQASDRLLLTHDRATCLVFEVENGRIGELRVAEPLSLAA